MFIRTWNMRLQASEFGSPFATFSPWLLHVKQFHRITFVNTSETAGSRLFHFRFWESVAKEGKLTTVTDGSHVDTILSDTSRGCRTNAIENGHLWWVFPFEIVNSHTYVSLLEGTSPNTKHTQLHKTNSSKRAKLDSEPLTMCPYRFCHIYFVGKMLHYISLTWIKTILG